MKRIATINRAIDLFGPGKDGFRAASPGVSEPTYLSANFFNGLQESILGVQETAGLEASDDPGQLSQAIGLIINKNFSDDGSAALIGGGLQFVASVAKLRMLRKTAPSRQAMTMGYYTAGDGGGSVFFLDPVDTASADNGGTVIVAADGGRWKILHSGSIKAKQFGLRGDGVTDDYPRMAALNTFANGLSFPFKVDFESFTYRFGTGFTTNPARTQYVANSATWDFSTLANGTVAIWLRGIGTAYETPVGNAARKSIDGVKIVTGPEVIGIDIHSDSGTGDSRQVNLGHVVLKGCLMGIYLGSNGWGVKVDKAAFDDCMFGIYESIDNADNVNFGECNTFTDCMFSGGGLAYYSRNYNSDAYLNNCHFDSAQAIDLAHGATAQICGGHAETAADTGTMFRVDGDAYGFCQTNLVIRDLTLVLPGTFRTTPIFECGVNHPVTGGGLDIDGLSLRCDPNFQLPNNLLVTGPGEVRARNIKSGYLFPQFGIAERLNQCADGGFLAAVFAKTDLDPLAPDFPPEIVETPFSRSGRAMRMTAAGGAFVGAKLSKSVRPGQKCLFNFGYKLTALTGGAKFVVTFQIFDRKGGTVAIDDYQEFSGTTGWVRFSNLNLRSIPMPPGAESITATVYVNSGGGTGNAVLGDFSLEIID